MSQSTLQRTINDYRNRLDKAESAAMVALQDAHQATLATIQPTLDRLYQQIQDKLDAGEDIPLSWLYEQNRLQTIQSLVTGQIDQYGALSRTVTGRLQNTGVQLGGAGAQDMMQALVPASVQWSFGVPNTNALTDLIGAMQPGSPVYTLFNSFGTDAATDASHALITGIATGMNPRAIAPMVRDALNVPMYRAKTIARTEMLRSYRSAQLENYRANSDVIGEWRWTCALGANTCEACLYYDGQLFPLDEDMDFEHPNCRCSAIPVTRPWSDILGPLGIDASDIEDISLDRQSGMDWFNEQDESTQRQILGPRYEGWSNGSITFKDMVGMHSSSEWGDSIYVRSLKEIESSAESPLIKQGIQSGVGQVEQSAAQEMTAQEKLLQEWQARAEADPKVAKQLKAAENRFAKALKNPTTKVSDQYSLVQYDEATQKKIIQFFGHEPTIEEWRSITTGDPYAIIKASLDERDIVVYTKTQGVEMAFNLRKGRNGTLWYMDAQVINRGEKTVSSGMDVVRYMQSLQDMGINRISTMAIRQSNRGEVNGYWTWAQLGFTGKIPPELTAQVTRDLGAGYTRVEQLMQTAAGRKWWRANGQSWDATFDFTPGSYSMQVLQKWIDLMAKRGAQ